MLGCLLAGFTGAGSELTPPLVSSFAAATASSGPQSMPHVRHDARDLPMWSQHNLMACVC